MDDVEERCGEWTWWSELDCEREVAAKILAKNRQCAQITTSCSHRPDRLKPSKLDDFFAFSLPGVPCEGGQDLGGN